MKNCIKCLKEPKRNSSSYCKGCHNEYMKAYYVKKPYKRRLDEAKKSKRQMVIMAKDRPCADCGISYPYFVMDLDHRRGEKNFLLSTVSGKGYAVKKIEEELAKCDVVCANCHRIRTFKDRQIA